MSDKATPIAAYLRGRLEGPDGRLAMGPADLLAIDKVRRLELFSRAAADEAAEQALLDACATDLPRC